MGTKQVRFHLDPGRDIGKTLVDFSGDTEPLSQDEWPASARALDRRADLAEQS